MFEEYLQVISSERKLIFNHDGSIESVHDVKTEYVLKYRGPSKYVESKRKKAMEMEKGRFKSEGPRRTAQTSRNEEHIIACTKKQTQKHLVAALTH